MDEFSKFSVYLDGRRCNFITSCELEPKPFAIPETKLPRGKFEFTTTMSVEQSAWDALSSLFRIEPRSPLHIADWTFAVKRTSLRLSEVYEPGEWFAELLFGRFMPCRVERIQPEDSDGSAWVTLGIYNRFPEGVRVL